MAMSSTFLSLGQPSASVPASPSTMSSINLQNFNGEVFEVEMEIAKQSVTIRTITGDCGMNDEGDDPVPL